MRLSLLLLLFAACAPDPVGRKCELGDTPPASETVITTGSLDCISRLCLETPGADDAVCTAACADDSDCVADPSAPCTAGFACEVVTHVGSFADQPLCVCRDALLAPGVD